MGAPDLAAAPDLGVAADLSASPADLSAVDLAGDMTPVDMLPETPFAELDPSYLCSGEIRTTDSPTFRVDGLQNGVSYDFLVLGIDDYGNASPSALLTGVPQATENLLEALHNDGNYAGGFGLGCAIGQGRAAGAGAALLGIAVGLVALWRSRSRSRSRSESVRP